LRKRLNGANRKSAEATPGGDTVVIFLVPGPQYRQQAELLTGTGLTGTGSATGLTPCLDLRCGFGGGFTGGFRFWFRFCFTGDLGFGFRFCGHFT